jgi:hypothetical protein
VTDVAVNVPTSVTRVLVTGLEPNGAYDGKRNGAQVSVKKGGPLHADAGGVLVL